MKTQTGLCTAFIQRVFVMFLAAVVVHFSQPFPANATHIPTSTDINILRPPMPTEGYLNFQHPGSIQGEERTGWTDVRHPAQATLAGQAAGRDTMIGYDRSDHFVNARTTALVDRTGVVGLTGGIPNDFDFANKAWAQAGLSVIETATREVTSPPAGAAGSFTFPLSFAEEQAIMSANNAAGTGTVEVYYTQGISSGALAETWYPTLLDGAGNRDEGIFMANTGVAANPRNNTLAHELGHFLTDGQATHQPIVGETFSDFGIDGVPGTGDAGEGNGNFDVGEPLNDVGLDGIAGTNDFGENDGNFNPPDASHSRDPRNIVGNPQWDPGSTAGESGAGNPPWNIANSIDVVGRAMSTNPDGSPKVGGTNQIEKAQIQTVFSDADVAGWLQIPNDHGASFGDRADFDWVEDNIVLEDAAGRADNHPGFDYMVWEIGTIAASGHAGHDHDAWGELVLNSFNGPFFRTVDVVSQIGRYIDTDIDAAGNLSRREAALDYDTLEFSADGTNWSKGSLLNVFIPGWHPNLAIKPEDYVARWLSPIDARFVRVAASGLVGSHDRNVQIDAIIASQAALTTIPEPGTFALLAIGIAALLSYWWRKKRQGTCGPATIVRRAA